MADIPDNLRYTKTHEWVAQEADGNFRVGITDHAQKLLGDLVYIELPSVESQLTAETEVSVLESVKAAADVYTPVSGTILEVNAELNNTPNLVNEQPYGQGWLFRIRPDNEADFDDLLTHDQYQDLINE